ncbi:MAG: hypothetical protein F4W95_10640 [Chloroflexi bacterium]|nr:hypothetical protein [Chloroflexota bacterium]MYD48928.1 hypothetical protein [Chloroflexota bacterium]
MDWLELITVSRILAGGQPTQGALRRAISTAYYAMFHVLANSNADLIAGPRTPANEPRWIAIYRSLRHYRAENPLHGWPHLFSPPVQNFALVIGGIKAERESADYNPDVNFVQNEVVTWIDSAERAIIDFNAASPQERAMVAIATLAGQR